MRPMRSSLTLASLMVTAVLAAQAPEFRSGVQLLRIDASVRDKSGNPVTDLRPSDFTVTIDGKLRPVVFAQLFRSEPNAIVVAGDQTVGLYKANTESPAGQIVVFVVDRNALPPGTERPILESAAAMLAELPPGDAVGLASIPGPVIELTRDHAKIEQALRSITGAPQLRTSARNVTWDEAKAFARGDSRVIGEVMDRECASGDSLFCPKEVNVAAREVLAFGTAHAEMLLSALTSLARDLATVRGPKHLVLLSAGLPFDVEFVDRFKAFERAAAEARIVVDTVRLHAFTADASSDSKGGANLESPSGVGGLDTLATLTGGFPYLASGRGTGIFSRIISDVTTFYELGIESTAQDANGKLHDVKVRVNRPGLETRAAPSISVPAAARAASALDVALKQLCQGRGLRTGVPLTSAGS
jgi:VWFA-related protein